MTRIVWGDPDNRLYETGIDRGVFYPQGSVGVPWNGLISVDEVPSGADIRKDFYDGTSFRQQRASESFAAKISAITFPREFAEYDGLVLAGHKQQTRKMFGFSYRTMVTNDLGESSYLIHIVYNAVVSPSQVDYRTGGGPVNASAFNWDLNTIPEILPDGSFSAHVVINTSIAYPWALTALENALYGTETFEPRMPSILEVIEIFETASYLRITDHGDGTWTADAASGIINEVSLPFSEIRRNLFKDPLGKTVSSTHWGSTAGAPTSLTDLDGKTWARFTRAATGNVRLADIKAGIDILPDTEYRFSFELRSSYARTVTINYRPSVTVSGTSQAMGTVALEANVPTKVDISITTMPNATTSNAGVTIIHDGSVIGDTLDITNVNFELASTSKGDVIHGDRIPRDDWTAYAWLGPVNGSISVKQRQEEYFEITWPSAVWIDTEEYRVSSL